MIKIFRFLILCKIIIFVHTPVISADENPFYTTFSSRYTPFVDVDHQAGELEFAKITFRIGYQKTLDNGHPFYINIGPDHFILDNTTAVTLPPDAKSRGLRLGTEFDIPFTSDNRYVFGIELNPTFQSSNDFNFDGDSFRFNFSTLIKFTGESGTVWVLGAKIRPEYNMVALPIFGFDYQFNEHLSFHLVSEAPHIAYSFNDHTRLLWEFDYTFDEFEEIGGVFDGSILQIQDFATGIGIEHTFNDHVTSSFGVGGVFNRVIKYQDGSGKVVPDSGIYLSLKIDANF